MPQHLLVAGLPSAPDAEVLQLAEQFLILLGQRLAGTTHCVCELCGLEGTLEVEDGAFKFKFDPATEYRAHDTLSGKKLHGEDIFENEGRLMNLFKDEEFKRRKKYYTDVIAPTPSPSK